MIVYSLIWAAALFVFERIRPGSKVETDTGWYVRAISINLLQLLVLLLGTLTWNNWFEGASVFALEGTIPAYLSGFLAYFVFTFVFYWWHRLKHRSSLLWRLFHQLHHSPGRIEVLAANYLHPLDTASGLMLGTVICSGGLGLGVEGVAWYSLYLSCMSYFLHANIRVPRWVGYIIQTPQMHRRHHKFGKHDTNYSDIVWWDMLFGTYENPDSPCERCGFSSDKEKRVFAMMAFQDVHES